MFKTQAILAAAVCTVSLFAAPAAFAESVEVGYKDIDLATVSGQKTLERRITAAARKVCGYGYGHTGSLITSPEVMACYKKARTDARDDVALAIDKASDHRLGG